MNDNQLGFKVVRELMTLKHFSEKTIENCITSICYHHELKISAAQKLSTKNFVIKRLKNLGFIDNRRKSNVA